VKPPLEAILDAAARADLVVMGSRGREALAASSLGSLAQRVVTAARAPVLIVH
jgi:nucleotide-binding universal stress UspA family protein